MDPVAQIAELEKKLDKLDAETTALKEQLASATEKDDKDRIVLLLGMANTNKAKIHEQITAAITKTPPPPDKRPVLTRWREEIAGSAQAAVNVVGGIMTIAAFAGTGGGGW